MKVVIKDDLVMAEVHGIADGVDVPTEFAKLPFSQLRAHNNKIVNAADFTVFYVDTFGNKHITKLPDTQELVCSFDDVLIRDKGRWRVKSDADVTEEKWKLVREQRNKLLAESDWTVLPDVKLALDEKAAWANYRSALRDITKDFNKPDSVEWPVKP